MRLPRHSTVVAYLALFVSVGTGGAFAATQLAPNSVGSAQIRPGSIRMSDLNPSTVRELRRVLAARGAAENPAPSVSRDPVQAH